MKTLYEKDQIPLMELCVFRLGDYLANDKPRGSKINTVQAESIKAIMEAVQN